MKIEQNQVVKAVGLCSSCPHGQVEAGKPVCVKAGVEIKFFDAQFNCPEGLWKSAIGQAVYVRSQTVQPSTPSAWSSVAGTWKKAYSLGAAVASGGATPEVVAERRLSCFGSAVQAPCVKLTKKGDKAYCGACGCGEWALAELDHKLTYAQLECPLERPGFSNAKKGVS